MFNFFYCHPLASCLGIGERGYLSLIWGLTSLSITSSFSSGIDSVSTSWISDSSLSSVSFDSPKMSLLDSSSSSGLG